MRQIFQSFVLSCLLLSQAHAQTAVQAPVAGAPAIQGAASATDATPNVATSPAAMQQLQSALGSQKVQKNMGPIMVTGMLLGCVQKKVGQDQTQAFYTKIQTNAKQIEAYCKSDHLAQAQQLGLQTIDQNANDPVAKATLDCYDTQAANIAPLGGQEMANELARYSRWLRDPAVAHQEMTPREICGQKLK